MSDGTPAIGIIGGSGLYQIEGLERPEELVVDTPFGQSVRLSCLGLSERPSRLLFAASRSRTSAASDGTEPSREHFRAPIIECSLDSQRGRRRKSPGEVSSPEILFFPHNSLIEPAADRSGLSSGTESLPTLVLLIRSARTCERSLRRKRQCLVIPFTMEGPT